MTAAHNPIIKRIKGHTGRIKGMLTPGLRKPSDKQRSGGLSSIFTGFGGGKLKLAAQKMRALDVGNLGKIQPKAHQNFAETIPQKFQEVQELIHLPPKFTRETSIWSKIDRPLPTQTGARFDLPPQPDELLQGSPIQKFSMFPQPGQSLGDFKQQARSIPKPKTKPKALPKPRLDPSAQLFTSIQEISKPAESPPEIPEVDDPEHTEPPADPDVVQPSLRKRLFPKNP